jgi:hypothetical protein
MIFDLLDGGGYLISPPATHCPYRLPCSQHRVMLAELYVESCRAEMLASGKFLQAFELWGERILMNLLAPHLANRLHLTYRAAPKRIHPKYPDRKMKMEARRKIMRKVLTLILFVALSGLGLQLAAQQQPQEPANQPSSQQQQPPAAQPGSQPQQPPAAQPGSQPQQPPAAQPGSQQQTDASQQSAENFQGKITRAGDQLVFQEAKSQTTFPVDDQAKVAPYEGKSVKLTATVDAKTNSLHVVDISPSGK